MIDLDNLTIDNTHTHLKDGDFSVTELVKAYLSEIEKKNKELNVYLEVFDDVLEEAKKAEKLFKDGKATTLTGIPFAIKDNILIKGKRVSAASRILNGYIAPYDATVIHLLREAGAIFLGRANMDEFAMGSSTENSAFGPTKNPYDTSRVPGGSSGGCAAAISANMALAAIGSDTAGSVRQPASFCGLSGMYPTYGSVSRYGLITLGSSLDQIGPFGKTVSDTETIFKTIRGYDSRDANSLHEQEDLESGKEKMKIGVPRSLLKDGIEPDVLLAFNKTLKHLEEKGHTIVDIEVPRMDYALPIYYIILPAEASANLARYDGVRYGMRKDGTDLIDTYIKTRGEGFGEEVKRRILTGTYVLSHGYYDAYYGKAVTARSLLRDDLNKVFKEVDCIVTPTTPTTAFKLGENVDDPISMYLADVFTAVANVTGMPAISVPCGFDTKGLPIGFQCMASRLGESILFSLGKDIEELV